MASFVSPGLKHLNGQPRGDLFAETILRLQHRAINADPSVNSSFALPSASVVKPFSTTTSPSSQAFGFDKSGLRLPASADSPG